MTVKKVILNLVGIVFLLLTGCTEIEDPTFENELDPLNPNNTVSKAEATITSNTPAVLNQTSVRFTWSGSTTSSEFAYYLEGVDDGFGNWSSGTSITYSYLDESDYTFYVKEKSDFDEQITATSVSFSVDAVNNGLVCKRWNNSVSANQETSVDVWLEDFSNFKGFSTTLNLSGDIVITRIEKLYGIGNIALLTPSDLSNYPIPVDVVYLDANSFTGSGAVLRVYYRASGDGAIKLSEQTKIRNYNNENVSDAITRNARIVIQ